MDLRAALNADAILVHPAVQDWPGLLSSMMQRLCECQAGIGLPDAEAWREQLLAGEMARPTVLGGGIGYPHLRVPRLGRLRLCVALLSPPLAVAPASPPVSFVLLALIPAEHASLGLKLLAQMAHLSRDMAVMHRLAGETVPERVCALLREHMLNVEVPLTAGDIMRLPVTRISPELPLKEVTRRMLEHDLDAVGVVDDEDRLIGQITCNQLFMLGMPDFFRQLKSVSFIREFDSFERYFEMEAKQCARDVMSGTFAALPEDATVLEVVFEMAVRRHPKVHVVRDGRRIGVIDRIVVLDRMLNL